VTIGAHQDVLGLEIAMDDVVVVEVLGGGTTGLLPIPY
jgi:hypothetical protein